MYGTGQPGYTTLSAKDKPRLPRFSVGIFRRAVRHVHDAGAFTPEMLREEPVAALSAETERCLAAAVDRTLEAGSVPEEMSRKLAEDVFVFSGCKTYHELKEVSQLLRDDKGHIKSFRQFYEDVKTIHPAYNERYLEAEQGFAIHSAQAAAQWVGIEADGDRYDLTYRTASDDKVRASHAPLDGITLPPSHPFWLRYMTPNGWKCRCRVVQSRIGKYPRTEDATAMTLGEKATTDIDSKGRNRAQMFRFNPGKQQVIFPPNHPYHNLSAEAKAVIAEQVKERVAKNEPKETRVLPLERYIKGSRVSDDQLKEVMHEYGTMFPENYNGGLKSVVVKRSSAAFMSNGRYHVGGNELTLYNANFTLRGQDGQVTKFNPTSEVKGAFLAMRDGKPLTFNQEYAMESLWHETLHAKAKGWGNRMLKNEHTVRSMETVNQFCARHTYPQFVESLGGKASNQPDVLEQGYGYGQYLTNFRSMLKHHGIDEQQVSEYLMPKLLSEPYEHVGNIAVEYLKGQGVKNAEVLMKLLKYPTNEYEELFD